MKRYVPMALRMLLGLTFVATSLIGIFNLAQPPADYPTAALAFVEALGRSGYFNPELMTVQLVSGVALLLDLWTPLFLVVLVPVTVNILLFHVFLTPRLLFTVALPGLVVFALNVGLLWIYRAHYRGLLTRRARP